MTTITESVLTGKKNMNNIINLILPNKLGLVFIMKYV